MQTICLIPGSRLIFQSTQKAGNEKEAGNEHEDGYGQ
jgi:hypothetical protein